MKVLSKLTIGLATAAMLFVGCNDSATPAKNEVVKPTIDETSLGLRKDSLFVEDTKVKPRETKYSTTYAGSGHKFKRAFQDAPPMIPHDTTGMLPITINNNQCIGCHMPDVASSMGATPIPPSHFTNFRPDTKIAKDGAIIKNGHKIKNTSSEKLANVSIKKENKLYGGRFNCSQCHAPQSDTPLAVDNKFQPEYVAPDGASKSTWTGTKLMEGINTYEGTK